MTYDTINDARTIAGNGEGTLLAGRYRIVRQLGQGGMGSVWLAEDTQLDNKPFAIKMLPSILVSNKRAYRQLKDEALVAMKLTHPNIVTLRAFEENNGNPFLVMDYVDGQILDDYLAEKGTLTEDEVIRVLRPVAAALDYAHKKGVVHRDVKPGNVMIAKDGTPYILDFGIAREIQETMTRVTGKLSSGTLLYMSPEQLMGESPKPAQDVYSFAAMAYECLKGEPPFVRGAIEDQIKNKQPEPLCVATGETPVAGSDKSVASPNCASHRGSGALAASVMSGLAKKPEDRPATCAAVLEGKDIGRVEHVERVDGVGRARTPAAPQGGSRSRATAAILAVAALALVVAGGWWWASRKTSGMSQNNARERPEADPEKFVGRDFLREALRDSYRAKATETMLNARTALECLYQRENRWPHEILNVTKHNGYYVMDEKVAIALFKSNCLAVDCKETSENGRTIYTLRGKDRCGIVDPWAQDVLKNANANADGMSLLSLKVPSGGTVEDHRIYFAVDKDDDGFVDSSEGAPVNRVRAKAIIWCAGADGVLATDADNVYSWQRAHEVRNVPMRQPTISTTNAVVILAAATEVQSVAESTELVRLREEPRREREARKAEPKVAAESAELVRLREELRREKEERQAEQAKRDKEKIESLTAQLAKAQQQPVAPTPVVVTTTPAPVVQPVAAESAELVRLREELRREKEKRQAEQAKAKEEKRKAEIEAHRRKLYPEYYAQQDARRAAREPVKKPETPKVEQWHKCEECNGSGCSKCKGTGSKTCPVCKGSGYYECPGTFGIACGCENGKRICDCVIPGVKDCAKCNGKGYYIQ